MSPVRRTPLLSPADRHRARADLAALEIATDLVEIAVRRPHDVIWCRAALGGAGFVASAVLADERRDGALTVIATGPLAHLVDTLCELIPAPGATEEVRPLGWGLAPVPVEDVALLTDVVRGGDPDEIDTALDLTGLPTVPEWLREAAYGLDAVLTIDSVTPESRTTLCRAQLMPSGWFTMTLDAESLTRADPVRPTDLRTAVISACTSLVIAGAVSNAA